MTLIVFDEVLAGGTKDTLHISHVQHLPKDKPKRQQLLQNTFFLKIHRSLSRLDITSTAGVYVQIKGAELRGEIKKYPGLDSV